MKRFIEKIFKIRKAPPAPLLTSKEKMSLHHEFLQFMDAHPLPIKPDGFFESTRMYAAPQFALAIFFLAGGGVAYLAESAGPSDMLYAVKRNLNEEILLGISSFSPKLHAEVNSELLERRLYEIENLIAKNTLAEPAALDLRTDIHTRTSTLQSYIADAEENGDIANALRVGDQLDTILDAHNTILYLLHTADEDPKLPQTEDIIRDVESRRDELQELQQEIKGGADITSASPLDDAPELLEELERLHASFDERKDAHAARMHDRAEAEVGQLIEISAEGRRDAESHLKSGDADSAVIILRAAVKDAEKASIVISSLSSFTNITHISE